VPKVGRWRPFEEAREFARKQGLTSSKAWREWAKSDQRPKDIPSGPWRIYEDTLPNLFSYSLTHLQ
jgi:hypothetical protein